MKVVLFCGGLGTRLREFSDTIPKPMVTIGYRPIIWHIMKYYAHYGHKDFILCLGYRGDTIKEYFLNYNECLSNDFTMTHGGKELSLINSDIEDWNITFVDTGLQSNIGQRLLAVKPYLEGEEAFLANYADGLSDIRLSDLLDHFHKHDKIASFLSVQPSQSFHVVAMGENGLVSKIHQIGMSGLWINGGYFILRKDIFDYLRPGEDLVNEPFQRLIGDQQLISYTHTGFWACMDTFKDKQMFDDMYSKGYTPWEAWKSSPKNGSIKKRDE
ncbi:MAG: glucose-1-phosphate cytidylyltransferase [candidate division Zixibacteria bacterium]|nr:glucose-1-phosphate cytidylyltransferase [candidate division Zixibacteria bacterium]